jgi:beta-lactamase regulating signal transducer with metallopeptidase domain/endonuclease YncB( thermonuclease family)
MITGAALALLLLDAALKGSVLLLLAWAATRLLRRASAAARHLVWSAALAGVVLLPVLGAVVPRWRVLPLPALGAGVAEVAMELPSVPEVAATAGPEEAVELGAGTADAMPAPSPDVSPWVGGGEVPSGNAGGGEPLAPDWRTLLLLAWAAGTALLALRLGFGLARVWWLERRAEEITDDAWVRAVDLLARRLRVGRIVTLLRAPGATVPMTWGLLRPVVLLPAEADAWDDERRAAVLAHELAHVRRWDAATQWVAHLARVLFWFNPLVWMACRRVCEEREHACDDAVLAMGTQPTRYADHLLEIVRALGTAEGPAAALAMARRSQFEGRLLAILDRATPRGGVTRRGVLATLCATAACVVPLAALGAAPPVAAPRPAPAEAREARSDALDAGSPAVRGPAAPTAEPAAHAAPTGIPALQADPAAAPAAPAARAAESPEVAEVWKLADDGSRARYLAGLVEQRPDSGVYAEIARAAARMSSPTSQRQVLTAVIACPDVGRAGVLAATEAVPAVRSSTDQREVLAAVARHGWLRDAAVRPAYFRSLETVPSSSDRRELLRAVLERGHTDPESMASLIAAAGRLSPSSDAREVLAPAARTGRVTGELRDLYVRAASRLADESDRAYALAALLGGGEATAQRGSRVEVQGAVGRVALPSDTPDGDGWTTRMVLEDGRLAYDEERGGEKWQLGVEGSDFMVQTRGTTSRVVVRPGGRVVLRETGRTPRSLEIRADARGRESRTYRVDGTPRPMDAQAEAWTAAFLDRLYLHLTKSHRASTRISRTPEAPRARDGDTETWSTTQEIEGTHDDRPSHRMTLHARDVRVRGGEVVGILPGGSLAVEQTLYPDYPDRDPLRPRAGGTTTRRLEGRRADDGGVRWTYTVNGAERPFGDEGRAWLRGILRKYNR